VGAFDRPRGAGDFKSESDLGAKGVAYLYGAPCTRILCGFAVLTIEVYVFLATHLSIFSK
jgi:hypothetical protein